MEGRLIKMSIGVVSAANITISVYPLLIDLIT